MSERAGQKAQESDLVNIDKLIEAYFEISPDVTTAEQKVAFGEWMKFCRETGGSN